MTPLARFVEARDFLLQHRDDYDAARRGFRWPQLDTFNWALDYFDTLATGNDRPGLWTVNEDGGEQRLSFAELSRRSNQVANFLRGLGVRRGDRLLVMLGNAAPLWEAMLAAMKLGAVIIPATTLLTSEDLRDRFDRGQVRHVIVGAEHTGKFDPLPGSYTRIVVRGSAPGWHRFDDAYARAPGFHADGTTRATDPLLLYFTSGTTSQPKLVLHTHQSYPVGHLSTMYWLGLRPDDVHLNISSPGWAKHPWSCFFAPWNAGATVLVYNYARFSARAMLDVVVRCGVTTLCAPPTVWRMLIQEDLARYPVRLRDLASAGEPLNPEVIAQVRAAWHLTIRDGFGQTETSALVGNSPRQTVKPGSMGRPLPGFAVELVGADGQPAEEGEICVRLDTRPLGLMQAYADDAAKTAEVMRDGYYHTGDVGQRDADGYITYVGRADDVFKASGYRISPFELESVLIEHPAVAEAAVVPSPDAVRGYVPKAYVITAPGHAPDAATAASIFRFLRERLGGYKLVRRLEFSDLPKTISGKIRRVELRGQENGRPAAGARSEREFLEEDYR